MTEFQSRSPEVISPVVIFLEIPNKLVLEVEGTDSYDSIEWSKEGEAICLLKDPKYNLTFFGQVLYSSFTNQADYGQYRAEYRGLSNGIDFLVLNPGEVSHNILVISSEFN